jgi:hypothetical protein
MTDEEFERSIRALREEGDRPAPQARLTRERILADLRPKSRRRRAIWLIPIAAILAGSTVLAATGRLPEALHAAARALGLEARPQEPKESTAQSSSRTTSSRPSQSPLASSESVVPAAPAESPAPPPTAQAETSGTAVRSDAGTAKRAAKRAVAGAASSGTAVAAAAGPPAHDEPATSSPPPAAGASSEGVDDQGTLALYRRARRLQLDQKPAEALAAWDTYLAAEPRGPLSVDARYGRALCLLRLGRKQEARVALEPFAAGKFGTYRQSEARALLDAMP